MGRLDGKVAVVTGASAGIGRAVFERFGAEGARLVGVGRNQANLDAAAEAARAAGGEAVTVAGDVSKLETAQRAVEAAVARFGGLDIVVNNAAVGWTYEKIKPGSMKPLAETPPELWREILGINLDSVYYMIHEAIPEMRKRGGGAIVNVASVNALFQPDSATIDSGAAKAALVNVSKSLAQEFGARGIRVNNVSPGPVASEASIGAEGVAAPVGRYTTAEEVATLVVLLASKRTANVTGASFVIDGGLIKTV